MDIDSKSLDYRALAEGLRVQIFWRIAGLGDLVADHYLRKQRSELDWIRSAIVAPGILEGEDDGTGAAALSRTPDPDCLQVVLKYWVLDQADYFRRTGLKAESAKNRLTILGHSLYLVSLALAALRVGHVLADEVTMLLPLVLGFAALVVIYAKIMAFAEHAKRYRWMSDLFAQAAFHLTRLLESGRNDEAQNLVRELGQEALIENSDWVLLHRERPLDFRPR
jgi:hypothetical protein